MERQSAVRLDGRTAVITGAASGIGRALAFEAASRGVGLALCDIDGAALRDVEQELVQAGVQVFAAAADIADAGAVEAFAAGACRACGSVALVFANAGIMRPIDGLRPDLDAWRQSVEVNLMGAVHMIRSFMGRLLDAGAPAQFVITASQGAFLAAPGLSPYIATKHALWGLAETLRMELAATGGEVGVSLLAPGRVRSAITAASAERLRATRGEESVKLYEAGLLDAHAAAKAALDGATARSFWILPAKESHIERLNARIAELVDAERAWLQSD